MMGMKEAFESGIEEGMEGLFARFVEGGEGSGNFGHSGRQGQRGGSKTDKKLVTITRSISDKEDREWDYAVNTIRMHKYPDSTDWEFVGYEPGEKNVGSAKRAKKEALKLAYKHHCGIRAIK